MHFVYVTKVYKNKVDNLLPQNNEVEGDKEEWKSKKEVGLNIDHYPKKDGKDMVIRNHCETRFPEVENFVSHKLVDPTKYNDQEELFNAIKTWWIRTYKKKETTIKRRLDYARKMSEHPIYPINWITFNPVQIINYLEQRQFVDYGNERGFHQIKNEWKTVNTFAKAYGLNIENWGYYPPEVPKAKVKIIPLPNQVHTLMHTKYSKNLYENALVQYTLTHGFIIGWRPSTIVIQKMSNVYIDDGYLIVNETKKNRERQIFPEKDILINKRRKSFNNWIECWRPIVANEYSGDYLYLQPNGRPFTVAYLRKYLAERVKPVWQYFHPYIMRHWCAIARLIKCKIESNVWDKAEVQDWLGHDKVSTTEEYIGFAKKYYLNNKYDWIRAVLKYHSKDEKKIQDNGLNSITEQKTFVSTGNKRRMKVCSRRDSNPSGRLERPE